MSKKQSILKKVIFLFSGFLLITLGISLSVVAKIGIGPWDVFHQGLSQVFHTGIGEMGIYVGLGVLLLAMTIKVYPGIGTICNIVVIGIGIDLLIPYIPSPDHFVVALLMNVCGVIFMSLGSVLYLAASMGAGPRDSFLIGIMQKFKVDTTYVKPIIEGIVLVIGIILGGNFGVGTFLSLLLMGFFMDKFFKLFNFDPKTVKQLNLNEQFKYVKGVLQSESSYS